MRSRSSILFSVLPFYVLTVLGGVALVSVRAQDAGNAPGATARTPPGDKQRNVNVYFSAWDSKTKTVTDLKLDELKLTVDGVPQKISTFVVPAASSPLTFDLLLDVRGSRAEELPGLEQKYAYTFFTSVLRPRDLASIREFSDTSRLLATSSGDPVMLAKAVSHESPPHGRPRLLQAIYDACTDDLASGKWRKAILLVSDGLDHQSKVTPDAVEKCLRRENVAVYAVCTPLQVGGRIAFPCAPDPWAEEMVIDGTYLLSDLAKDTGGYVWTALDEKDFRDALAEAVWQIRGQYTIGFTGPAPKPNGKPHKMKLKTSRKGITLFAPEYMPDGEPIGP